MRVQRLRRAYWNSWYDQTLRHELQTLTDCDTAPCDLLIENRKIFIPHLYLATPAGVTPSEFREDVWSGKTRMIPLPYGENTMTIC